MARGIKEKVEAKSRGNKVFKSMSEERLLSSLNESESVKESENEFDDARIKKIFMNFRDGFSKTKIKEIRKEKMRKQKNLSIPEIKEIEKNLLKLEKNHFKLKRYYYDDDIEYRRIRDVKNLFDLSIDEDYYKLIITNSAFISSYIEYEIKGDKDKIL